MELKTRRKDADAATLIRIEGSKVMEQEYISAPVGTSIAIRNLFFNIPARRNFLKSIAVESKHIMEEFQRQTLAHPEVAFKFYNNESETYNLRPGSLEDRIREVLGVKKTLLDVLEQTEIIGIEGFIGVPEMARKTRGDQFFFVNGRFIRSPYFNHAVQSAFEGTIENGAYPLFVLNLSIDPSKVDVNVHPTKTEVKFEDERHIYNILKAAVRKALGMHIVQPGSELFGLGGLEDFLDKGLPDSREWNRNALNHDAGHVPKYNPFSGDMQKRQGNQDWARILGPVDEISEIGDLRPKQENLIPQSHEVRIQEIFSLKNKFIIAKINDEMFFIDPFTAQEKVYFHTFSDRLVKQKGVSQQLLFPRTADLNPARIQMFLELKQDFQNLGFNMDHFGGNSVIINGLPPELHESNEAGVIEKMLEDYELAQGDLKNSKHDRLALSLARQATNRNLSFSDKKNLEALVGSMFALPDPLVPFRNKPVAMKIGIDFIQEVFKKR
ncbi:MAG: hypothetical protein IT244_01150 [Bacteroidia bacterium]|nr:hypothetical protein [Bacteroidia bacterium]